MFSSLFRKKRIFLDYSSSTPIHKEVLSEMQKYNKSHFANPSALYEEAMYGKTKLNEAKSRIGMTLNCSKENIVLTSGGTEANNIAILGVFEKAKEKGILNPHIISSQIEHPSVKEVLNEVESRGGQVTFLLPDCDGLVSAKQVVDAIKENTVLVSLMYANNEIGTVLDIKEIGQKIKKYRKNNNVNYPYFHTDACQAPLYFNLDMGAMPVDLMSIDGIKIYGPRSSGILFIKNEVDIKPIFWGGGQEKGIRSGTEDVAKALGLAKSLELAKYSRKSNFEKVSKLRDYLIEEIKKDFSDCQINGSLKHRSPNNVNICFKNIDAEYLTVAMDTYGVCVSYSSSCRTLKEDSSSYVIEYLGKPECKNSSIRFSLGLETTKSDLDFAVKALKKAIIQVSR